MKKIYKISLRKKADITEYNIGYSGLKWTLLSKLTNFLIFIYIMSYIVRLNVHLLLLHLPLDVSQQMIGSLTYEKILVVLQWQKKFPVFLWPNLLIYTRSSTNTEIKKYEANHTKAHYKPLFKTSDKEKI